MNISILRYALFSCFLLVGVLANAERHPDCTEPSNIRFGKNYNGDLVLVWDGPLARIDDVRYEVRYRKTSGWLDKRWTDEMVLEGRHIELGHLQEGETYEFQIRKICDGYSDKFSLYSDWVDAIKLDIAPSGHNGPEAEFYTGEECEYLTSADVTEIGGGTSTFVQLNVVKPAYPDSLRYMIRYRECQSVTGGWQEAFILNGSEITLTTPGPICKIEGRVIHGGSGENYEYYCPWKELYSRGLTQIGLVGCNGDTTVPDITNSNPLGSATVGDQFQIGGIPVVLESVDGGDGIFSGIGLATLPFTGLQARVQFLEISVNEEYQVMDGQMKGYRGNANNFPWENIHPPSSSTLSCKKKKGLDGWDENGNHRQTGGPYDPNGFDINGNHKDTGGPYDPYGFDKNGNHRTGGKFNEDSCSRDGVDPMGKPCDPKSRGPNYWTRDSSESNSTKWGVQFLQNHEDSIRPKVVATLIQMRNTFVGKRDSVNALCDVIRTDFLTKVSGFTDYNPDKILGPNNEYVDPGMSKKFKNPPHELLNKVPRSSGQEEMEKRHIDLYDCDLKREKYVEIITVIDEMSVSGEVDAIVNQLRILILQFSESEANEYEDDEAFNQWILEQLMDLLENRFGSDLSHHAKNKRLRYSDPGVGSIIQTASMDAFDLGADIIRSQYAFLFEQGDEKIAGVHRAFYIREMTKWKAQEYGSLVNTEYNSPLAWTNVIGGENNTLYLDDLELSPQGHNVDIYFILDIPTNGDSIVFEALNVQFGPGGAKGNTVLRVNQDFTTKLFNTANLIIKGTDPKTYVAWNCNGFAGLGLVADIQFCKEYFLPVVNGAVDTSKYLTAHLETEIPTWGELVIELDLGDFVLTNWQDVQWKVQNIVLDYSELETPQVVKYPEGYVSAFASGKTLGPMWKGFYLGALEATLPKSLNKDGGDITIGVQDVIIDNMGFSGIAKAKGSILDLSQGSLDGWAYSIDTVGITVLTSDIVSAGFGGDANVPILSKYSKAQDNNGNITKDDCLEYVAWWYGEGSYALDVSVKNEMSMPLWKATVTLYDNTAVYASYNKAENELYAEAELHGKISVSDSSSSKKLHIPSVGFQGLVISNKGGLVDPGTWSLGDTLGADFGGFHLAIHGFSVKKESFESAFINLKADVGLEFSKFKISGTADIDIYGKLEEEPRHKWKYDHININEIGLAAEIAKCHVTATLKFFDSKDQALMAKHGWTGDQKFGSGFRGDATLTITGAKLGIEAMGLFGRTNRNGEEFKYFMVDALGKFSPGIPIGPVTLVGAGGGLWYRMDRDTAANAMVFESGKPLPSDLGESLSGVVYEPMEDRGIGLKLAAVLTLGSSEKMVNANASISMTFGLNGGLKNFGIQGNAKVMADIDFGGSTAKGEPGTKPPNTAPINANMDLNMDFDNGIFTGSFETYVNALGGSLKGIANNHGLMTWAEIYAGGGSWYVYSGTPKNPCGLRFSYNGLPTLDIQSYLCMGTRLPSPRILNPRISAKVKGRSFAAGSPSRGIIFGSAIAFSHDKDYFNRFYAKLYASLGLNFEFAEWSTVCEGSGQIGINGWYASGVFFADLEGEVGIKWKSKRYRVLSLGATVLLSGGLPNPFYAHGYFEARYNILGFIKGKMAFDMEVGDQCIPVGGGDDPTENIIVRITPNEAEQSVAVDRTIDVDLNIPVRDTISIVDIQGNTHIYYLKVDHEKTKLEYDGYELLCEEEFVGGGQQYIFTPQYFLPYNDSIEATFAIEVTDSTLGTTKYEEKTVKFYTGEYLDQIPASNVSFSYPLEGMQNFYQEVSYGDRGYIDIIRPQNELLSNQTGYVFARWLPADSSVAKVISTVEVQGTRIWYDIPVLANDMEYTLQIVKMTPTPRTLGGSKLRDGEETSLEGYENPTEPVADKVLFAVSFRVSQYNTFEDKVNDLQNLHTVSTNASGTTTINTGLSEGFDAFELYGVNGGQPLMVTELTDGGPMLREMMDSFYCCIPITLDDANPLMPGQDLHLRYIEWRGRGYPDRAFRPETPDHYGSFENVFRFTEDESTPKMDFIVPWLMVQHAESFKTMLRDYLNWNNTPNGGDPVTLDEGGSAGLVYVDDSNEHAIAIIKRPTPSPHGRTFIVNMKYTLPDNGSGFGDASEALNFTIQTN